MPHDAYEGRRKRWKVIIVRLLNEIEYRGRQHHCLGRIVEQDENAALKQLSRSRVGALGRAYLRERIVPARADKAFGE